jgi:hypothetical protein
MALLFTFTLIIVIIIIIVMRVSQMHRAKYLLKSKKFTKGTHAEGLITFCTQNISAGK